jgi:hypothetical protein
MAGIARDPLSILREEWADRGIKEIENVSDGKSANYVVRINW